MKGEGSFSRAAGGRAERRRKAGQLPLSDSPEKLRGGHLAPSPPASPQPGLRGQAEPSGAGQRAPGSAPRAQRPPHRRPLTCAAAAPRQRPPPRPSARPAQRHAGTGAGGARRCRSPWGRAEPCRAAPLRSAPCRAAALPPAPPAPAGKVGQGGTEHARGRAGGRPRGPRGAAGGRRRVPRRGYGARSRPLRVPSGAAGGCPAARLHGAGRGAAGAGAAGRAGGQGRGSAGQVPSPPRNRRTGEQRCCREQGDADPREPCRGPGRWPHRPAHEESRGGCGHWQDRAAGSLPPAVRGTGMGELVGSREEAADVVRLRQSQVPTEGTGRDCFSLAQTSILWMEELFRSQDLTCS